jgi:hypothetical protein
MQEFVGYLTQVGVTGVVIAWLYFERQRAEKLQAERDGLLERVLQTMNAMDKTLENALNTMEDFKDFVKGVGGRNRP